MKDNLPYLFFVAWFLCGCSVDTMLDDWRAAAVAVLSLIALIVIALKTAPEVDGDDYT